MSPTPPTPPEPPKVRKIGYKRTKADDVIFALLAISITLLFIACAFAPR